VFRVTDLKIVSVATADLEGAVAAFRRNFSFPVKRTSVDAHDAKARHAFLGVGPAEIEVVTASAQGSPLSSFVAERGAGLYQLVLEVDDLEAARAGLSERGVEVTLAPSAGGNPSVSLNPTQTHGVRIALVGR
jgi:Glyoxalase/Bleomycin resistance protein/Dioxygenase superfamily